jgi:hypothetical protein
MKKLATIFACALALASCGSSTKAESSDARSSGESASKVVRITIKDRKVTPQAGRIEVKVGQPITLRVTSDSDDEIHVHSEPAHEYEIAAGTRGRAFTFSIHTPGQVAVELHHLDVTVVQLVVRP